MKQLNKSNSFEENLRDTKHNKKAKELFLKLLAKQKRPGNPFDETRSYSPPQSKNNKLGEALNDTN